MPDCEQSNLEFEHQLCESENHPKKTICFQGSNLGSNDFHFFFPGEIYMLTTSFDSTGSAGGAVYKFVDPRRLVGWNYCEQHI